MGQALNNDKNICYYYLENLHGSSKGYITKSEIKNSKYKQWHYKYDNLKLQEFGTENVYISMSTFYKPYRRIECLKELKALYIDLDIYNTQYSKDGAIYFLEHDFFGLGGTLPNPHYIIDSGRGLYIVWLIKPAPYMALPLWQAIEKYFFNELKSFGADAKCLDCTRILRVPDTLNSKSSTKVKILRDYIDHSELYTLKEIQEYYLPILTPKKEKKKGRPFKIISLHNTLTLYSSRIRDITKICELRNYDVVGHREIILFLYRYYLCYFTNDTAKALNDTLELNNMFLEPLEEREVIKNTFSAEKVYLAERKEYKYSNDKLIEILNISQIEQQYLETIISSSEKKRRDRERKRLDYKDNKEVYKKKYQDNKEVYKKKYQDNKEAYKKKYQDNKETYKKKYQDNLEEKGKKLKNEEMELLREKIKALRKQGFKNKEIATTLKVSLKTLEWHITYLKKNNSLA